MTVSTWVTVTAVGAVTASPVAVPMYVRVSIPIREHADVQRDGLQVLVVARQPSWTASEPAWRFHRGAVVAAGVMVVVMVMTDSSMDVLDEGRS